MLEEPPKEGEALKITGSVMQGIASSKEEILEKLKNDVYAQKVWDLENVSRCPRRLHGKRLMRCRFKSYQ